MGPSRYLWNIFAFCREITNLISASVASSNGLSTFVKTILVVTFSLGVMSDALAVAPNIPKLSTSTKPIVGLTSVIFKVSTPTGTAVTTYTITPNIGGTPQTPTTTATNATTFTVGALQTGQTYTFTIVANSAASGSSSPLTVGPYTPMPLAVSPAAINLQANSPAISITLGSALTNGYVYKITSPTTGTATTGGSFTQNANVITYTPNRNFSGADSISYQIQLGTPPPTPTTYPAAATVTINISPLAVSTTMMVPANTPTTMDLASVIAGTGITGVSISTKPAHGSVTMNGTKITYTPGLNYYGTDSFTYLAYSTGSVSANVGTISVSVGRVAPSQDSRVTGIVSDQASATLHFSSAQVLNFQQHLESRHQAMNMPALIPTDMGSIPRTTKLPTSMQTGTSAPDIATETSPLPVPPSTSPSAEGTTSAQPKTNFNNWLPTNLLSYKNNPNSLINQVEAPNSLVEKDDAFATLMDIVSGAVINSTLNLATVSNAFNKNNKDPAQMDIWASGNLRIGTSNSGGTSTQFKTDGISIGEDRRVNRNWLLGMGFGYAVDNSTVGTDGTSSRSTGDSVTFYSSYQFDSGAFVDTLLGYGLMNYATNRYDPASNDFAKARRTGSQWFGSASFGYDFHDNGLTVSPYGRYDFSYNKLNGATESGTNPYNYGVQKTHSSSLSFGLLGQTSHQTEYGIVQPHARVEYQRGIDIIGDASVAYADLLATQYTIAGTTQNSHSIVMGLGSNFLFNNTWSLGVDYSRLTSNQAENYQSFNFLLTKTFNEQKAFNWLLQDSEQNTAKKPSGLVASGTVTYDDNVTRADNGPDKLADTVYQFSASDTFNKIYSKRHLVSITAFADSYSYQSHTGLNELSAGLQAEYDYLANADFYAPIYGVFARGAFDNYNSDLRNGSHHTFGVNYHKTFTDRISLTSVISDNTKAGNSIVFTTHDDSALVNIDYINGDYGTFYLTGEYRKGDVVSIGQQSVQKLEIASWFVDDDAFSSAGLVAYRLKAVTNLYTLGYNYSFGPKDSVDISWRKVISTPEVKPTSGQGDQYFDNQYSLSYLLAF
jgi:outer membrane autotransporter protein